MNCENTFAIREGERWDSVCKNTSWESGGVGVKIKGTQRKQGWKKPVNVMD